MSEGLLKVSQLDVSGPKISRDLQVLIFVMAAVFRCRRFS